MKDDILAFLERAPYVDSGLWRPRVADFLKRPAALDFVADLMRDTGKGAEEAVFVLLAAIRYVDSGMGGRFDEPSILELSDTSVNLDLFMVRNHRQLWDLCLRRKVQANVPERALPILELLGARYPATSCACIELGASFGLLGRCMVQAETVWQNFSTYFLAGQQIPSRRGTVSHYLGIDLDPPDSAWILACLPVREQRIRIARFIKDIPLPAPAMVIKASALEFHLLPEVREFIGVVKRASLRPIILTSFLLYQLTDEIRSQLLQSISRFKDMYGGSWINLDVRHEAERIQFVLEIDGAPWYELDSDMCFSWKSILQEANNAAAN